MYWPYPDLRNGTTVNLFTDSHFGNANLAFENRGAQIMDDMAQLKIGHAGHVHSGDLVDWGESDGSPPEDYLWVPWREQVKTLDGMPWLEVPGNHDLSSFGSGNWRTSMDWAKAIGKTDFNTVMDVGDVRIIGMGPDRWLDSGDYPDVPEAQAFILSPTTLAWLDEQLSATTRPCILVTHIAPVEYDAGQQFPITPPTAFADIVGAHPNVVAHFSGHYHRTVGNTNTSKAVLIGGRNILCVNGPAAGGRMAGVAFNDYNYKSPSSSLFVTMLDEHTWDIRTRLHTGRTWAVTESSTGNLVERVTIPTNTAAGYGHGAYGSTPYGG